MKSSALVLAVGVLLCAGCASQRWTCGAGMDFGQPVVKLLSVTPTSDSPGRGSTFFPFPAPQYPYEMWRAGIAGEVIVRVTVGTDGKVEEAKAIRSSYEYFASPAVAAVERWRFFEFQDPGVKEHRKMVLDCRIQFEPTYDHETPALWSVLFTETALNETPRPPSPRATPPANGGVVPLRVAAQL